MSLTLLADDPNWRDGILQSNNVFVKSVDTVHVMKRLRSQDESYFRQVGETLTVEPMTCRHAGS